MEPATLDEETKKTDVIYVPLPAIPKTASPVPGLCSIHATLGRGPYGDSAFRGNCSGLHIRDLLLFYRPKRVLDPMKGSGTCGDVCKELGVACEEFDLRSGFDATDSKCYVGLGRFPFVWLHPPYWSLIKYSDDPRCLSNASTVVEFEEKMQGVFENCRWVLSARGKIGVQMGDGKRDGRYMGLPFRVYNAATAAGLRLAAPEIIRFQHGARSSSKVYSTSFIPRIHDVVFIFEAGDGRSS